MGSPFVGEVRLFGGNFAPNGWALCQGQLMSIAENPALFQLVGTTYGGDGQNTFGLPDLQGRVPVHQGTSTTGTNYAIGERAGTETVTLNINQIPVHNHLVSANAGGASASNPSGQVIASGQSGPTWFSASAASPQEFLAASAVGQAGGSQPHDNMVPFLVVNFIISLFGIFPSQN
ncbi:MAG TPA: tail fiber protein [Bryobacteraceae bacterium]|jgi:microcystin-dependent protein|nr:tail fiber protein [Bryobacteraceae bacterium]